MSGVEVVWNTGEANALLEGANGGVMRYLFKLGLRVESSAKRRCPVDTGRLRGSIQTVLQTDGVIVGSNVDYAGFVNDGTRFMSGRHFLDDALAEVMSTI